MKLSDLSTGQLCDRLKKGLSFKTGAFTFRLTTKNLLVATSLHKLYADYVISENDFADFHIQIDQARGIRRWIRPQALFHFDGFSPFKPLPLNQAFPLLEWGMNWCVSNNAHGYLIIHSAVIEKNGHAAILPAPPGSGKSTLCAALICRGWRLLSDELCLIRLQDGAIIPLPRPVSLKNKSIDVIQSFHPPALFSPRVFDTIKGTVAHMKATGNSVADSHISAKAGWIIFPKYQQDAHTSLSPLAKSRSFMRVAENSFNYSLLGHQGFHALKNLIDASNSYEFTYSILDEAIATFDQLALAKDVS